MSMGFSTGAALAVEYSLARLEGEELPRVDALVLLSPAIGVDPLAWLAVWQERMSMLPGLGKLAWLDLIPEYDPYKYNSFPVNAGHQIYTSPRSSTSASSGLSAAGPVRGFPRTLVFQSVADATVSPLAVVQVFLGRLSAEGHELVDLRHQSARRCRAVLARERALAGRATVDWCRSVPFGVTLITNESETEPRAGGAAPAASRIGGRRHAARTQLAAGDVLAVAHCAADSTG